MAIEILWSKTIGLCKKLNIIYNIITCNPEPQANGAECDAQFTNQSFEPNSFEPVLFWWTSLTSSPNQTEPYKTVRTAQIHKLLNQNSLSDAWQLPRLEISQNTSVYDTMMNELIQCSSSSNSHWTEEMSMFHIIIGCFNIIVYTLSLRDYESVIWTSNWNKLSERTSLRKIIGFPHCLML